VLAATSAFRRKRTWEPVRRWHCRRVRTKRWSLDFLSDTLIDGRRFRILAVVVTSPANPAG